MKKIIPTMEGCLTYIKVYNIEHKSKFINKFIYNKRKLKNIMSRVIDDNIITKEFLLDFIKYYYKNNLMALI